MCHSLPSVCNNVPRVKEIEVLYSPRSQASFALYVPRVLRNRDALLNKVMLLQGGPKK